jgi:hypothetical protein
MGRTRPLWAWLAVVVVAAIGPYLPSLRGKFVLDDVPLIVNDALVHSIANIPKVFFTDFLRGSLGPDVPYYRPLVTATFQVNYWLFGPNPLGFRITNVLLHAAAAVLVLLLTLRLTRSVLAAGVAGVAFAVLPAHAEPVAWISGRTDVLSCIFVLLAFLTLLPEQTRRIGWPRAVLGSALFLCGLLSKEIVLVLPGLVLAYAIVFDRPRIRRDGLVWIAVFVVPLMVYILLRREAMDTSMFGHFGLRLKERIMGVGIAYASYLRMLFVPRTVKVIYDVFPIGIKYPWIAVLAWMLPLGLAAAGFALRRRAPVVAFGSWWMLIALLPVTNIILTLGPLPAERFCYLASAGSAMVLGWLASRLWDVRPKGLGLWRPLVAALVGWYALYCAALTIEGSQAYTSNLTWARRIAATNGRFLRGGAGAYFAEAGCLEEAQREYEAAVRHEPDKPIHYLALERVYLALGKPEKAADTRRRYEFRFPGIKTPPRPYERH